MNNTKTVSAIVAVLIAAGALVVGRRTSAAIRATRHIQHLRGSKTPIRREETIAKKDGRRWLQETEDEDSLQER